jgi:hypothetical protein
MASLFGFRASELPPYHAQTPWNDFVARVPPDTSNFVQKMTSIKKNEPWLYVIHTNTEFPAKTPAGIKSTFEQESWNTLKTISNTSLESTYKKKSDNLTTSKHIFGLIQFAIACQDPQLQAVEDEKKYYAYFPADTIPLQNWQDPNNYSLIAYYRKNDSVFALFLMYNAILKKQISYHVQLYLENDGISSIEVTELTDSKHKDFSIWKTTEIEIMDDATKKLKLTPEELDNLERDINEMERLVGTVHDLRKNIKGKQQEDYQKHLASRRGNQPSDNAASNGQPPAARAASAGPKSRSRSRSSGKGADSAQPAARSRHPANDPAVDQGPNAPPASQIRGTPSNGVRNLYEWTTLNMYEYNLWTAMALAVLKKPEGEEKKRFMHIFLPIVARELFGLDCESVHSVETNEYGGQDHHVSGHTQEGQVFVLYRNGTDVAFLYQGLEAPKKLFRLTMMNLELYKHNFFMSAHKTVPSHEIPDRSLFVGDGGDPSGQDIPWGVPVGNVVDQDLLNSIADVPPESTQFLSEINSNNLHVGNMPDPKPGNRVDYRSRAAKAFDDRRILQGYLDNF